MNYCTNNEKRKREEDEIKKKVDELDKDQILAATMTPEAIPEKHLDKSSFCLFLTKNTTVEPKVVPKKGISNPNHIIITIVSYTNSFIFVNSNANCM